MLTFIVHARFGQLPECPTLTVEELYGRVHMALRYMLKLLPSANTTLSALLDSRFPSIEESKKVHLTYINNLLRIVEYAPELQSEILALITDRVVKIDVHVQLNLDDADDEVSLRVAQALSEQRAGKEADTDASHDADDSDAESEASDDSLDAEVKRAMEITKDFDKLDCILDVLFSTYAPFFADPTSAVARSTFSTLLAQFVNIILPTYRSRHTQFLLFHFAQASDALIDNFAGTCVQLFPSRSTSSTATSFCSISCQLRSTRSRRSAVCCA